MSTPPDEPMNDAHSVDQAAAPLVQPAPHDEPLNSASSAPLPDRAPDASASLPASVGLGPGLIHPDVWAVLDELADGMSVPDAAALIDRKPTWLRDNLRNKATQTALQARVIANGDLMAIKARKALEWLCHQDDNKSAKFNAASKLLDLSTLYGDVSRGSGATGGASAQRAGQGGKSVVVVLEKRSSAGDVTRAELHMTGESSDRPDGMTASDVERVMRRAMADGLDAGGSGEGIERDD